mgnify:CR=1 FL=1
MFLDFLEKRSEEVDDTPRLTDEEKLFLKVFGIEEDQPAAAMKEATYFTCMKKAVGSSGENAAISYPGHGNRRKKGKRTPVI